MTIIMYNIEKSSSSACKIYGENKSMILGIMPIPIEPLKFYFYLWYIVVYSIGELPRR